ncbi:MAG: lysophospholipid acyltransferase family protein [Pseudomonadota bacterium]
MKLSHQLAGKLILALMRLIALLPLAASQAVGRWIGGMNYLLDSRGAKVTMTNLSVCFPSLDEEQRRELARQSLEHTGQMLMETPASWLGNQKRVLGWIAEVENEDLLKNAISAGRGAIVILPHIGNWELLNAYMNTTGSYHTGLYAPPNQDYMKVLMAHVRSRFGNEIVPTTVKGIATLYRRLEEGKLVVVLPDQVPATGQFAPFFGVEALTDVLITRLIRRTPGVKVLSVVVKRLPHARGFKVIFNEAHPDIYSTDAATALGAMNMTVEACVRLAPAQYQWEYKRFKERPAGERRLYNYDNEPWTHH